MVSQVRTHLMFEENAETAMDFYVALFDDSTVLERVHYDDGELAGRLHYARFTLAGTEYICIDSPAKHEFGFTPAMSLFVDCESADEQSRLYDALVSNGSVLMPLDDYGFSTRFAWVRDRFGVSWQLNPP